MPLISEQGRVGMWVRSNIWLKFLKMDFFPKYLSLFFNFNACFMAFFALRHLLQLVFLVKHVGEVVKTNSYQPYQNFNALFSENITEQSFSLYNAL